MIGPKYTVDDVTYMEKSLEEWRLPTYKAGGVGPLVAIDWGTYRKDWGINYPTD